MKDNYLQSLLNKLDENLEETDVLSHNLEELKEIILNFNSSVEKLDTELDKVSNSKEKFCEVNRLDYFNEHINNLIKDIKNININANNALNIIENKKLNITKLKSNNTGIKNDLKDFEKYIDSIKDDFKVNIESFQSNINKNIIQLYDENRKFKEEIISFYKLNKDSVKNEVIKPLEKIINSIDDNRSVNMSKDTSNLEYGELLTMANNGDPKYQFILGEQYFDGNNVKKDYKEAILWFNKAAKQGYTKAILYLGYCYGEGLGVRKNKMKMIHYYKEAANKGNIDAQFILGECYFLGNGVLSRKKEAIKWFSEAAKQGDSEAQFTLGEFYRKGTYVSEDIKEAIKWYEKSAKNGHKKSIEQLEKIAIKNI